VLEGECLRQGCDGISGCIEIHDDRREGVLDEDLGCLERLMISRVLDSPQNAALASSHYSS
jgi:hypothetical protein